MLMIRLQRTGRKNNPSFRVVLIDSKRGPKSGNFIETLGSYEPKLGKRELKAERIVHWISKGAKASGTVHNMLVSDKVIEGKKINVLPKKKPILKEGAASPETAAAPQAEPAAPADAAPEAPQQ